MYSVDISTVLTAYWLDMLVTDLYFNLWHEQAECDLVVVHVELFIPTCLLACWGYIGYCFSVCFSVRRIFGNGYLRRGLA